MPSKQPKNTEPNQAKDTEPKRALNEGLLKEAGMTIVRHPELNLPHEKHLEIHKISHDWAKLLSKDLLDFGNVIHKEHKTLSGDDKAYIGCGTKRLLMRVSDFPEDKQSQVEFVRKWPQAGPVVSQRQHKRALQTMDKFRKCHGRPEEQWKYSFRMLLDDIEKKDDPLERTHPGLSWLSSLEEIRIEGELTWLNGQRELERNRQRNPGHKDVPLTSPKPDNQISFAIRSDTAERSDQGQVYPMQNNCIFHNLRDDPVVNNFSFSTLSKIAQDIDEADSPLFSFFPAWAATSIKRDSNTKIKSSPASIGCFPWLICEHKPQPEQEVDEQAESERYEEDRERKHGNVYCQAANACAVSLTILARLVSRGSFESVDDDARHHVRPVFAITSIGEKTSIWVAYISKIDKGFLQFEMHEIWNGSLFNYVNILELCIFLDRLHYWAVKSLKPWISSCIDHWKSLRCKTPPRKKRQSETLDTDMLAGLSSLHVTNGTISERQSGNQGQESSNKDSACLTAESRGQTRADQVCYQERRNRSPTGQNAEPEILLHQAQSTAGPDGALKAGVNPISIDENGKSNVQSDQSHTTGRIQPTTNALFMHLFESETLNGNAVPGAKNGPSEFTLGLDASQLIKSQVNHFKTVKESQTSSTERKSKDVVSLSDSSETNSLPTRNKSIWNHNSSAVPTGLNATGNAIQTQTSVGASETSQRALVIYKEHAFQDILTRGDNLLLDIECNLRAKPPTDLTKRYIEMTEKTSPLKSFKPHCIALLGGSGVGKSSLINALLGLGFLVPANSGGEAVTRFATEYYHDPNIEDEFLVNVEYQTKSEIRDTIKSLIADYRNSEQIKEVEIGANESVEKRRHAADSRKSEQTEEAETEANELVENRRQAAQSALNVLFKDKPDWQRTCGNADEIPYQTAVDEMTTWIENCNTGLKRTSSLRLNTVLDCNTELEELGASNLWPLIKTVRVGCKSANIDEGIVLLDLPGLRDTNDTRVRMTETQIMRADHVFLVAVVDRVETCPNFRADIKSLVALRRRIRTDNKLRNQKRKNEIKVTIVCTKTDTLKYDQLRVALGKTSALLREVEAELQIAEKEKNTELIGALKSKLQDLCISIKIGKLRAKVQEVSQEASRSQLNAPVFLVTTEECKNSKHNGDCTLCEIPQLRRHCSELIAGDRLRNAQDFVKLMLPGLIAMMRSWYDGQRQDKAPSQRHRYSRLRKILVEAQQHLGMACDGYRSQLELPWTPLTRASLRNQWEQWDKSAMETVKPWGKLNVNSHRACCRRGGMAFESKSAGNNGMYHWNEDLLEPLMATVSKLWDAAELETSKTLEHFIKEVQESSMELTKEIESCQSKMFADETDNLLKAVSKSVRRSETDLNILEDDLDTQLGFLRELVLEDESPSSMLGVIMRPTYQAAADAYGGPNSRKRQQQIIVDAVDNGIFEAFVEKFSQEISSIIRSNIETAQTIVDRVRNDLNMLEKDLSISNEADPNNSDTQLYRMLERHLKEWEIEAQQLSGECRAAWQC